jgi:Asp-tRNA(Asn)/Glu-tRNA(Gln) amidotransferase A subunit family amidase
MAEPHALGVAAAAAEIAAGRLTAEALTESCLARITAREAIVGAWEFLDPAQARAQARALDRGPRRGPLHGIPVGIKDIIDTADMPTGCGSPIYRGRRPAWDAACVALLRAAGAVILGKTVTTEFAYFQPGKTANPHDPRHTPGGSSSGSAAAVADRMAPAALGTQTAGSVIRPASFCGVIGYKPSFGDFSLAGIKPFSPSLDTLGVFARHVEDLPLLRTALLGIAETVPQPAPPRIGLCRTAHWPLAEAAARDAVEQAATRLSAAGATVAETSGFDDFAALTDAQKTIMAFEAARAYAAERSGHGAELSAKLRELLAAGIACPLADYRRALDLAEDARRKLDDSFRQVDLLLAPSAVGEAPEGRDATGDPIFNRAWTLLHVPAITLPLFAGPRRLPVGIQLIGRRGHDAGLIAAAAWIERSCRTSASDMPHL